MKRFVLWIALLAPGVVVAESLDTIIIDRGYDKQTRIAVVPFLQGLTLGGVSQAADIISADLARSGQFAPLPTANMLSMPTSADQVHFRDWRVLGVEYLVIGRGEVIADGRLAATYELFDVVNERMMLSERLESPPEAWRDLAHGVADGVFEAITGIRGAFGTKLVYVLAKNAGRPDASYSLEISDADGERSRTLFSSNEPILSARWAPDGQRVAYVSFETGRPSIVLHDLRSGARERITNFKGINGAPAFSPDGRQMAMVLSKDGNPEIYLMDLGSRSLRRITEHYEIDTEPSWAPDGKSLIFTSSRAGQPQIYRLELATNLVERLTFRGDYNARGQMMETGEHMVFVHRDDGVFHIAWMDLARDDVRVLTQTRLDESPSLAPNGAMLIYATQHDGRGILGVVSIDGRVKYRLPSSSGDVREPAWSPYIDNPSVRRTRISK